LPVCCLTEIDGRPRIRLRAAGYLSQLDTADRQEPSEALATKTTRLKEKLAKLGEEIRSIATTPHGWSGLALTAFEIFSAEIR
jgi:hypothetical protein